MTKPILFAGLVLVCLVVFFLLRHRNHGAPAAAREFKSTDEYIQFMANAAVEDAENQHHIQLDYSIDSIKHAEEALGRIQEQYVKNEKSVNAPVLANMYGAYIGEVIRRSEPGASWERDHPVFGPKTYPLHWAAGDSFPMAWCYRRITEGEGDNVWIKYSVLKKKAMEKPEKGTD